jgi:hypothetical protein
MTLEEDSKRIYEVEMMNKTVPCNFCKATGKVGSGYGSYGKTSCPVCFGRGQISIDAYAKKCAGCNGSGRLNTGYFTNSVVKHETCRGTGWISPQSRQIAGTVARHERMC